MTEPPVPELIRKLIEALEYYGNPGTYFGIAMIGDPPHGDFFEDFEKYPYPGDYSIQDKPGRRAREALRAFNDDPAGKAAIDSYVEAWRAKQEVSSDNVTGD